jgi:hypothetical protein
MVLHNSCFDTSWSLLELSFKFSFKPKIERAALQPSQNSETLWAIREKKAR